MGKYHVLLCKVSRDTLQSIISLKKCHRWTDFLGYHRFCRTRIALRTRMWSLPRLCCMSFLRTRIVRMTRMWSLTRLCCMSFFKNTNSSNDMRIWSLTRLCSLSFFKNTNSSNDTNVEPDWLCSLSFLRTRIANDTNREPNSALYERKNNKYNRYNKYNRRKIMLRIF